MKLSKHFSVILHLRLFLYLQPAYTDIKTSALVVQLCKLFPYRLGAFVLFFMYALVGKITFRLWILLRPLEMFSQHPRMGLNSFE